jgi:hypothetical protein
MGLDSNVYHKEESLKGCIFPVLIGGLLIFILALVIVRISENKTRKLASQPEPPLPGVVIPADIPKAYEVLDSGSRIRYKGVIGVDEEEYVICGDKGTSFTIEFDTVNSIKGLWSGYDDRFKITSPFTESISTWTHYDTWPDVVLSEMDPFTPYLSTRFNVEPEHFGSWFTVKASLDVTYPVPVGAIHYENAKKHLEREFRLFAVSSEDIQRQIMHAMWKQAVTRTADEPSFLYKWFWPLLAIALILVIVLGLFWSSLGASGAETGAA